MCSKFSSTSAVIVHPIPPHRIASFITSHHFISDSPHKIGKPNNLIHLKPEQKKKHTMSKQSNNVATPALYLCDMSRQLMWDPLISSHGYTFEKKAILRWLNMGNNFCPCSGKDMSVNDLVAARSLREEIHFWRAENGHPSESILGMTLSIGGSGDNTFVEDSHDELLKDTDFLASKAPTFGPLHRIRKAFKVVPRAA